MIRTTGLALLAVCAAAAAEPARELAERLGERLGRQIQGKTVLGEPIKVGSTTLIPILSVDVDFAGGGMSAAAQAPAAGAPAQAAPAGGDVYYMRGEARPVGFVVIGPKGARLIRLEEKAK